MILGLFASGFFSITFGLSTTFAEAMLSRFLFGLANNVIPMGRVVAVELLGPEHAVIGMAFLPGSRAIGTIIGPVMGGLLAQPAVLYPSTFSSTGVFARYPFLLPNLAVAFLAFTFLPFVMYHLPETLDSRCVTRGKRASTGDSSAFAAEDGGDEDDGTRFNNSLAARVNTAGTAAPQLSSLHLPEQDDPSDDCKLLSRTAASSTAKAKTINSGCGIEFKYLINEEGEPPCRVTRKRGYGVLVRDGGDNSEPPKSKWDLLGSSPESSTLWFGPGGLLTSSRVRRACDDDLISSEVVRLSWRNTWGTLVGFDQMYPLWLLATKDTGGLQWSMPKIGKVLGWAGVGMLLFQFALYPALCRTLGIVRLVRLSGAIAVVLYLVTPDIQHTSWSERNSYVVGVAFVVLLHSFSSVAEIAATLASANAVPVNMRGKFGGIFSMSGSLGRVIGPATFSSLLAWSLESTDARGGVVDYHVVFVLAAILMVVIILLGRRSFTLESMTVPIENRGVAYSPFPLVHDDRAPSRRDGIARGGGVACR
eukprot:jgi/Undpi1/6440/HiC_scaffold_20.g08921.m1